MTLTWVLGRTGLLGAALCRVISSADVRVFTPQQRFSWTVVDELHLQMKAAVLEFSCQLGTAERWEIYWAAGVGTMSSSADTLVPETQALSLLLQFLAADSRLTTCDGTIAFASSAGAIYAGSPDEIITENSLSAPTTAYATEKLKQEELIREFISLNRNISALIARISTLYGAGQACNKKQGLLGHIARSVVRNQPVQIYVPFDTIRDYIDVEDAAVTMINATALASGTGQATIKIIASERPVTIAEIVSIFMRLARRAPRVIRSANRLSTLYSRRVQFTSIVFPNSALTQGKRLPVGIGQLLTRERIAFAARVNNQGN